MPLVACLLGESAEMNRVLDFDAIVARRQAALFDGRGGTTDSLIDGYSRD